jgi:hypothetical protein
MGDVSSAHGAAGDPDDVTPDRGWDVDAFDDALEYRDSHNRAGGTGTDPEMFYEGRPDELHLDSGRDLRPQPR